MHPILASGLFDRQYKRQFPVYSVTHLRDCFKGNIWFATQQPRTLHLKPKDELLL